MKLNCLGCGNTINLSEAYESYSGQIKCNGCCAILKVKMQDARLVEMEFVCIARPSVVNAEDAKR